MKKNRIYFGLLILALVVTIVWTSAGMLGVNKEEKKYSVSVIVNDSNNDRWMQCARDWSRQRKMTIFS